MATARRRASPRSQATPPREPPRGPVDRRPRRRRPARGDHRRGHPHLRLGAGRHPAARLPGQSDLSLLRALAREPAARAIRSAASSRARRSPASTEPTAARRSSRPALDGHLYAFDGDGDALPGFPVRLVDPDGPGRPDDRRVDQRARHRRPQRRRQGRHRGRDQRDLRRQPPSAPSTLHGLVGRRLSDLLGNAAGGSSRVYAVRRRATRPTFLHGWPIKLNGAIQDTLPLIGPGQDPSIAKIGGQER